MEFNRQPFQHEVDTVFFFAGGSRGEVVEEIETALAQGVPLVTLTGTDGSGKTMVCRKVEQSLDEERQVLFFEQGVESFDEVIEGISARIGLDQDDKSTDRNLRLNRIVEHLKQEQRQLLIVIDGAESIFLATLERIRKMADLANGDETTIQLLLSGQPLFLLNFKQLGIVAFQDLEERNYSLDPLDAEMTYRYLNHCIDIAVGEDRDFFSPRMADRIMDTARGNFRLINQLADRYVTSGSLIDPEEAGFDDDSDEPAVAVEENGRIKAGTRLGNVDLDFLKVPRLKYQWYVLAGGLAGLLLVLFLLIGGEDESAEPVPETEKVPDLTLDKVEPDPIEIPLIEEPEKPEAVSEQKPPRVEPVAEVVTKNTKKPELTAVPEPDAVEAVQETSLPVPPPTDNVESIDTVGHASPQKDVKPETVPATKTEQIVTEVAEKMPDKDVNSEPSDVAVSHDQKPISQEGQADEEVIAEEKPEDPEERAQERVGSLEITEPETDISLQSVELEVIGPVEPKVGENSEEADAIVTAQNDAVREKTVDLQEPESVINDVAAVADIVKEQNSPQLAEDLSEPEQVIDTESIQIPELTVITKKKQRTESVPFTVVTLKDERKRAPVIEAPSPVPKPKPIADTGERQRTTTSQTVEPAMIAVPEEVPKNVAEAVSPPAVPAASFESEPVVVQKPAVPGTPSIQKTTSASKTQNPHAYYAERLAAGSRWLVGSGRNKYTVQLMVLPSELAERNIGKMLNETGFQSIRDETYLLRKAGQPQTVTLYFGEFNSQEEARQAQQKLPQFLQDMNPDSVAVNDAVNKARSSQ